MTPGVGASHNEAVTGVAVSSGRILRAQIDDLVAQHASLRTIELEVIDPAPLGEDARDALWLYAWGCLERQRSPVTA